MARKSPTREKFLKSMVPGKMYKPAELVALNPDLNKQHVYILLSQLVKDPSFLERESDERGHFKYRLKDTKVEEPVKEIKPVVTQDIPVKIPQKEIEVVVKRSHIHWSDDEKWMLAEYIAKYRIENPHVSFSDALFKAQRTVLPENRRRYDILEQNQLPWIGRMLDWVYRAKKAEQPKPPQEPPKTDVSIIGSTELFGEVLRRITPHIAEIVAGVLDDPRVKEVLKKNEVRITGDRRMVVRHKPEIVGEERPKLKKIMIYGLNKPIHQNEIKRDFGDSLDIRIGDMREPGSTLKERTKYVDTVILMTDHIKHSLDDTLKKENVEFVRMRGNIAALREKLHDIIIMSRGH